MFIQVAVPVPALEALTYRIADGEARPPVGARVVVPLGTRTVTGIVVDTSVQVMPSQPDQIKQVVRVLDTVPFIPAEIVGLARWAADYYMAGQGDTLTMVLPPNARGVRADAHKTRRTAEIKDLGLRAIGQAPTHQPVDTQVTHPPTGSIEPIAAGASGPFNASGRALTTKQLEALGLLARMKREGRAISGGELAANGISADSLNRLARLGLVALRQERVERDPFASALLTAVNSTEIRRLTDEQQHAVERLTRLASERQYHTALVHGVTGSGKTEVYLRVSAAVRAGGRRAIVLVPEIALTPAVAGLFRQAFGDRVAIQHSGLSDGERHDQWQKIRRGDVDVVVGTRSAVFAPLPDLGLVIVDEEHDASYKQEESPRYNARDVAIVRAQRAGALAVLGSATPSMETYHNAVTGRYEHIVLDRRVLDRPLADVRVVDMREAFAEEGPDVVLSAALREGLAARLEKGEQSLVLLNRRGYATSIFCRQCAETVDCPNCSVSLVVHGTGPSRRFRCHYCGYSTRVPTVCPSCAGAYMEQTGFGTERVEAEVQKCCPTARVARLDRDAVRRKGALLATLSRFRDGEIDVLVGTQMIAKGHDFPRVTLVGVVSADVGLGMADFRSAERTFQLLTQVAGRAGRGESAGEAIVQTLYPEHYSIALACRQDYGSFYEREFGFRRSMQYPPTVSLVNAVVRARTFTQAMADADEIVRRVRDSGGQRGEFRVLGPAPAPIAKLRGEYRAQLLVKGSSRRRMREALAAALARRPDLRRRVTVDVDPLSVL